MRVIGERISGKERDLSAGLMAVHMMESGRPTNVMVEDGSISVMVLSMKVVGPITNLMVEGFASTLMSRNMKEGGRMVKRKDADH